jgi:hypothetical protein
MKPKNDTSVLLAIAPFIPTNPDAAPQTGMINLTWQDNSANETGFQIFRKNGDCALAGNWSLLKTTSANAEAYSDTL